MAANIAHRYDETRERVSGISMLQRHESTLNKVMTTQRRPSDTKANNAGAPGVPLGSVAVAEPEVS